MSEFGERLVRVEEKLDGLIKNLDEHYQDQKERCKNHGERIADLESSGKRNVAVASIIGIGAGGFIEWLLGRGGK